MGFLAILIAASVSAAAPAVQAEAGGSTEPQVEVPVLAPARPAAHGSVLEHIDEAMLYARMCSGLELDAVRAHQIVMNAATITAPRLSRQTQAKRSLAKPPPPWQPNFRPPFDSDPDRWKPQRDCLRGLADYGPYGLTLPGLLVSVDQ